MDNLIVWKRFTFWDLVYRLKAGKAYRKHSLVTLLIVHSPRTAILVFFLVPFDEQPYGRCEIKIKNFEMKNLSIREKFTMATKCCDDKLFAGYMYRYHFNHDVMCEKVVS